MACYSTSAMAWLELTEDAALHIHSSNITYGNECCAVGLSPAVLWSHFSLQGGLAHSALLPGHEVGPHGDHVSESTSLLPLRAHVMTLWQARGDRERQGNSQEQLYWKDTEKVRDFSPPLCGNFQVSNRQKCTMKGFHLQDCFLLSWFH